MADQTADAAAAAAAAAAAKPWYDGAASEVVGHLQTKGWDKLKPNEAALQAITAHREAEKMLGVPAAQLVRLPTDAKDEAGWKAVWQRLGAPADAKEYDFTAVKRADGTLLADPIQAMLRDVGGKTHIPKDAMVQLGQSVAKYLDDQGTETAAVTTAALQKEQEALDQNWGANKPANLIIARNAAKALGVTEAEIDALQKQIGYARTMEMFRSVGTKIGEDKFITDSGAKGGTMTKDQAVARKAELMADSAWVGRYMAGGAAENRELTALLQIISS